MSARHLQEMLGGSQLEHVEEDEDSGEDIIPVYQPRNSFLALAMDDDEEEEEEEEEEEVVSPPPKPKTPPKPSSNNRKAQNKAKKNKRKKNKRKQRAGPSKDDKILQEAIKEVEQAMDNQEKKENMNLLGVDTKYLLAANEIKRLFGSEALDNDEPKQKRGQMRNRRNQQRQRITHFKQNTKLTKPNPQTWPPIRSDDLSMHPVAPPDNAEIGVQYFEFKWSSSQLAAQELFTQCIETGDPNSLFQLLGQYPYHVGSLLQLSELLKQTGDFQRAADFIERALFAFESGWHHEFDWKNGKSRILHKHKENRELFYALFRHIQMLGRRGCCRTGLECCKLLLSFDLSDPLFVVGMIDYYAIRSKQFNFLLDFFDDFSQKPDLLPNLYYSAALAAFMLNEESPDDYPIENADCKLQKAIITFPVALPILVEKCKKPLQHPDTRKNIDLTKEVYFSAAYRSPTLFRLVNLYIDRCYSLWTSQSIQNWLSKNVAIVLDRISKEDSEIEKSLVELQTKYPMNAQDSFSKIQASEYNDEVAAIPADLLEQQPAPPPRRIIPAQTANPFALFLRTLIPWNEVPNAPYQPLEVNEGDREHFMQQVLEWAGLNRADLDGDEDNLDNNDEDDNEQ